MVGEECGPAEEGNDLVMKTVYDYPLYYEIAFSFRDIAKEVEVFEECIARYSGIAVRRFLEIASGNSPHMKEIVRRGYEYTGLDISEAMLDYSRKKAGDLGDKALLINADMRSFSIPEKADFAFVALGSWFFLSTDELVSHLNTMAQSIRTGGLYFLDWCIQFSPFSDLDESWTMQRGGITVKTSFTGRVVNLVEQIAEEKISLEVIESEREFHLEESVRKKAFFPQEFVNIIEGLTHFELVGWWNNWDLDQPLERITEKAKINRPIILLRRI